MGSPLSPVVANIILQDLEIKVLERLFFRIYYTYIDDILFVAHFNHILKTFNLFHERLQFTSEISNDDSLYSLDVKIMIDDHRIIFDCYKKTYLLREILKFLFAAQSHKISIIYSLVDKILTEFLSNLQFYQKNLEETINILLNNCQPLRYIFHTI